MHLHLKFRNGIEGDNLPWKELWKAWCSTQIQFCFFFFNGKICQGPVTVYTILVFILSPAGDVDFLRFPESMQMKVVQLSCCISKAANGLHGRKESCELYFQLSTTSGKGFHCFLKYHPFLMSSDPFKSSARNMAIFQYLEKRTCGWTCIAQECQLF